MSLHFAHTPPAISPAAWSTAPVPAEAPAATPCPLCARPLQAHPQFDGECVSVVLACSCGYEQPADPRPTCDECRCRTEDWHTRQDGAGEPMLLCAACWARPAVLPEAA